MLSVTAGILKIQTVISWRVYIIMVTQFDWSWYLDVGSSLITCCNKSTRRTVYQYDSATVFSSADIWHTQTGCVLWGEIITKIKISVVTRVYLVKSGQHREIGSTQKRNLMKSGENKNEISWNRVITRIYQVKSGQHREIESTQKRNLMKSGQHKNEISWNHVNTRFSIHYTICKCLC